MGKIVSGVTRGLGLSADPNAGAGAAKASQAELKKSVEAINAIDIPDIERQKLQLQLMQDAGFLDAEELGRSAMEDVTTDPKLRDTQMAALEGLRERGKAGLTTEDKAQINQLRREEAGRAQSEQGQIMQGMAERGALDSGASLAAMLAGQQGSAQRGAEATDRLAMESARTKREALEQAANAAGNIRGQDFSQQSEAARAKDVINQFNAQNRQNVASQNLGIKQQDVGIKNQEQQYNKGLEQQQFSNKLTKEQAAANARSGVASSLQAQSQAQAAAAQADAGAMRGLLGAGMSAMNPAAAVSDKNKKEEIKPIHNMLDKLKPYEYEYKDDDNGKKHTGVMAQDLEKSKEGDKYVDELEDGTKVVNYAEMASTLLASNTDLHKRIKKLEKERK